MYGLMWNNCNSVVLDFLCHDDVGTKRAFGVEAQRFRVNKFTWSLAVHGPSEEFSTAIYLKP